MLSPILTIVLSCLKCVLPIKKRKKETIDKLSFKLGSTYSKGRSIFTCYLSISTFTMKAFIINLETKYYISNLYSPGDLRPESKKKHLIYTKNTHVPYDNV
jgi:hypothetical protein